MNTESKGKEYLASKIQMYEQEIKALQDVIAKQRQVLSEEKPKDTSYDSPPNPSSNNYYQRLGISPLATQDEIRKSYKKCSVAFHPDRNTSPNANEQFRSIKEAYDNLIDEKKRKEYDLSLTNVDYQKINKEMITNIGKMEEFQNKKRELEIEFKNINKASKTSVISHNFLVNTSYAEKELKKYSGLMSDDKWLLRNSNGKIFTVTNREISAEGSDDTTLNNIIDIYIACEKSKYAAAGKLDQFDISKLNPTAKGTDKTRLLELCKKRGIGFPVLEQHKDINPTPIDESKALINTEQHGRLVRINNR